MNNFHSYITPEQAKANGDTRSLAELKRLASKKLRRCDNCNEKEWRLGGCGLCFSCTTGEADASDDYELATITREASEERSTKPPREAMATLGGRDCASGSTPQASAGSSPDPRSTDTSPTKRESP